MARIVVITHEYDSFLRPRRFWQRPAGNYLLFGVLQALSRRGHRCRVAAGLHPPPADAAILHVDSTHIAAPYLALAARYPVTLNFGTADISKRRVSGALLTRNATWPGPVIVKTDLNHMGQPEAAHNAVARGRGHNPPHATAPPPAAYPVLASIAEVAAPIWDNPALVVERFIPEPDPQGHALRTWVFLGNRERCSRHVAADPMVKATNSIARTAVPVPDALRAERARLGFDYGKFDFVLENGVPVLLDANRTPGHPPSTGPTARTNAETLADGLENLLRTRC